MMTESVGHMNTDSVLRSHIAGTNWRRCTVVHNGMQCENRVHGRGWCRMHYKRWQKHGDPLADKPIKGSQQNCAAARCDDPVVGRGYCSLHYQRWRKYGDPMESVPPRRFSSHELRFWSKVDMTGDCWLWNAHRDERGYGIFSINSALLKAHRFSYELAHGPIPDELQVDHKCGIKPCVNPDHLRAVTSKQNAEHVIKNRSDNTSGVRGVTWRKRDKKWDAFVTHNGKRHHVGYFRELADAEAAVVAKRNELFTHNDGDRK